jgi:hypothetical protein
MPIYIQINGELLFLWETGFFSKKQVTKVIKELEISTGKKINSFYYDPKEQLENINF